MASSDSGEGVTSSTRGPRGQGNGRGGRGGQRSDRERPDRDRGDRDRDYRTGQGQAQPSFDHHRRGGGGRDGDNHDRNQSTRGQDRDRDHRRDPRPPNPSNSSGPHIGLGPHKGTPVPILRGIRKQPQLPPRLSKGQLGQGHRASIDSSSDEVNDKNCIVCYKEVKYYSVGSCNHSVCFECSARMRVLMEQNECPICRQTLEFVIMTKGLKPFKELQDRLRMFIWLPKWGIYLEGEEVSRDFDTLLEHRCPFCREEEEPPLFGTFKELKSHIHKVHEMYACDLCSDNIKLFSKERRFYTRQELATHKRKGDRNDKSHRGHPICEFCDRRYFDSDELYKHLRKDHYFCHFCDADGLNHYYNTYDDLRIHFRKEHFLCEEEGCKDEKFTSVFRSEIDMKAHLTAVHSRLLGKHGTKAARMIDVEFNMKSDHDRSTRRFNGDGAVGGGGGRGGGRRDRGGDHNNHEEYLDDDRQPFFEPTIHVQPKVDSVADFPCLEGSSKTSLPLPVTNGGSHANSSIAQKVALATGKNVINKQQQPSSGGGGGGGPRWNAKVTGSSRHDEEFPALGPDDEGLPTTSRPFPNPTTILPLKSNPKKPPESKRNGFARPVSLSSAMEEFPSLGKTSGSATANGSAWIGSGVKKKQMPKSLKVAKPPLERKIEVDPFDNFQFVPLSVSRARKDSLTEKYESILAEEEEAAEDKATKKKKKGSANSSNNNNNNSSNAKVKAAAAIFNDGKPPSKGKTSPGASSKNGGTDFVDDFPSLSPMKKSHPPKSPSPKPGSGPPPGFSAKPLSGPPSQDLFESSSSSSFLTKTKNNNNNNTGPSKEELELLKAKLGSVGKVYVQPPEFGRRSARLLEAVKSSLNGDESSFDLFKSMSNQYRKAELNSKEYYELCQDMFGISDFRVIFPELLALLPDVEKQQELLASHRRAGGLMKDLASCHECFQVIKTGDMSSHLQSHAVGELFPAL